MALLPLPNRDSLGWLIPVLLFCVFYGIYLIVNETGLLHTLGVFSSITGALGLAFSRRVRRLITYHALPKTPQRREQYAYASAMDQAKRLARKEKVPELITSLYFNYIVHLPQWLTAKKLDAEVIIPDIITSAKKMAGNRIVVTISGREYIFTFVQYVYSSVEGERDMQATLQVASTQQKLILLHLVPEMKGAPLPFRPISIEYVLMTDWVNDFRHIERLIREESERLRHEDQMD